MISSFEDVITMLMKHGATRKQAVNIMYDVHHEPMSACQNPDEKVRRRERSYQMAKWAIEKAKEYGRQNAETTMGYRE
jgi:ATP-dependent Clp protease adapter protein ClpS